MYPTASSALPTPNKNTALTSLVQARLGQSGIFIARLQVGGGGQTICINPSKRLPQTVFDARNERCAVTKGSLREGAPDAVGWRRVRKYNTSAHLKYTQAPFVIADGTAMPPPSRREANNAQQIKCCFIKMLHLGEKLGTTLTRTTPRIVYRIFPLTKPFSHEFQEALFWHH